jgi:hypothetical protein
MRFYWLNPNVIKDDATGIEVAEFRGGISNQQAVRLAIQAHLERIAEAAPPRERMATLRKGTPDVASRRQGQALCDDLSGGLWR